MGLQSTDGNNRGRTSWRGEGGVAGGDEVLACPAQANTCVC